jgi:hypothetical protein
MEHDITRLRALTAAGDAAAAWELLLWSRRRADPTDEAAARRVIGGEGLSAWMTRADLPRLPTPDARRVLCDAAALLAARHDDGQYADTWSIHSVEVWSADGASAAAARSLRVVSLQPSGQGWLKANPNGPTQPITQPPTITAYGMPPLTNELVTLLAPEALSGEPSSPATDVYALAITCFIAWTGTMPFLEGAPSLMELLRRIMHPARSLPPAQAQEPGPDADTLRAVLLKSLQASPSDRFPTARSMHSVLEPHPPGPPPPPK